MQLLHPERLVWLLLLPVLWWLARPPAPRAVLWTPHFAQWQQALARLGRTAPRRRGLPFVLLALAATAAVLALAEPVLPNRPGPLRLVVLCDRSASLAQVHGGQPAWAVAEQRLRERLDAVPPWVDVTLLRCGGPLLRRHGPSARALHDLGAPAGAAVADLPALAASLASADTAVLTVTDGQGQAALPAVGGLLLVGAPADNAAVLAVRTTDHWPLPELELEVDVVRCAAGSGSVQVTVSGGVEAAAPQAVVLEPGVPVAVSFALRRLPAGGRCTVQVAWPGDALPADDRCELDLPPLPAPRIAVLDAGDGGPFAMAAARALAQEVGGEVGLGAAGTAAGLLLVDGGIASLVPGQVRALTFGCQLTAAPPTGEPVYGPVLTEWDRAGPLLAGLELGELRIAAALPELLPPGEVLLWGAVPGLPAAPLAVVVPAVGRTDLASVHFAFRLVDSNLPLLAAFPQLLRRLFVRCYGSGAEIAVRTEPPPLDEVDLRTPARGPERALPEFGAPAQDLRAIALAIAALLLGLRAWWR